mgnify:CR=1 FL=1
MKSSRIERRAPRRRGRTRGDRSTRLGRARDVPSVLGRLDRLLEAIEDDVQRGPAFVFERLEPPVRAFFPPLPVREAPAADRLPVERLAPDADHVRRRDDGARERRAAAAAGLLRLRLLELARQVQRRATSLRRAPEERLGEGRRVGEAARRVDELEGVVRGGVGVRSAGGLRGDEDGEVQRRVAVSRVRALDALPAGREQLGFQLLHVASLDRVVEL